MLDFYEFPSIESFMHVYKHIQRYAHNYVKLMPVYYYPMTKLHGTNASIVISDEGVSAQKRTGKITTERDNFDFAKFVKANEEFFMDTRIPGKTSVLFGEWIGPGIQKGVAIAKLPRKVFCPFMYVEDVEEKPFPFSVVKLQAKFDFPERNIYPLALDDHHTFMVNFFDDESVRNTQAHIEYLVKEIEAQCPFAKQHFDIEGSGEGFVAYPMLSDNILHKSLIFKAKGEKHRDKMTTAVAAINPEVFSKCVEFAKAFCTPHRLEQGISEVFGSEPVDIKRTGEYIAWTNRDVLKESTLEFQASGLDWKPIAREVSKIAREHLFKKASEISV